MAEALRICVVTETFPPEINGVAMTLSRWITQLTRRGHSVQLVRPARADESGDCPYASETVCVPGMAIPGYRELRLGLPAWRRLRRAWQQRRPDVVYVATEGPLGWSAIAVACKLGIPALSGFHTQFHQYSRYYRVGWLRPLLYRYLTSLHNKSACTLVPTEVMRQSMANDIKRIEVVGRGVDTALYHPDKRSEVLRREWGVGPNDKVFLYVGRLAKEKNIGLAIETFFRLRENAPSARLVLVGNGPDYQRLYSIKDGLIFVGAQVGESLARHYASADIFLFPSTSETFGNVVLEAMASGLGVVAFDHAAAGIHISHGHNGMLAGVGDEASFVRHGASLLHNRNHLLSLRHEARRSMAGLSWEQVGGQLERILSSYANRGSRDDLGNYLAPGVGR